VPSARSTLRKLLTPFLVGSLTFGVLAVTADSASAVVPVTPSGLSPNGTDVSGIPTLSWTRQADAATYDVEVSATNTFSTKVWTDNTVNIYAVPTVPLPVGTVYWRVRARNSSGAGEWSVASVTHGVTAAPVLTGPADGAQLQQPGSPPILTWNPLTGVDQYTIQISTDDDFIDPALYDEYTTPATSFVLPDLQIPQVYYWRAKGRLAGSTGIFTEWSVTRSYEIFKLEPATLVSPPDDINNNVQDVVLDWNPVAGAATYELQVSTDSNFLTIIDSKTGIRGTKYSPLATYDNDQYYWRVRGVDGSGNKPDWSTASVWKFKRNWPHQPSLQWPANGASVGNPFYYQWSGVKHASFYLVEISSSPSFTAPVLDDCTTVHTTLNPFAEGNLSCAPSALGTYYWRVIAYDATQNVVSDYISAEVRSFTTHPPWSLTPRRPMARPCRSRR
jgi:hypothetical protein